MSKKQVIRINESQFNRLIKESVRRVLKESYFDDAENDFQKLRDYYADYEEGKDSLIDSLWYFIGGNKPEFIKYMKVSAQWPFDDDYED